MKKITHFFAGLVAALWAAYQYPGVADAAQAFLKAHPHLASIAALAASLLALYHDPKANG